MPFKHLTDTITAIFIRLRCIEIINYLSQNNIDKIDLLNLLIVSKFEFDAFQADPEANAFLNQIEESSIYSVESYRKLVSFIINLGIEKEDPDQISLLSRLLNFHKMLYKTGSVTIKLMRNQSDSLIQKDIKRDEPVIKSNTKVNGIGSIVSEPIKKIEKVETFETQPVASEFISEEAMSLNQFLAKITM